MRSDEWVLACSGVVACSTGVSRPSEVSISPSMLLYDCEVVQAMGGVVVRQHSANFHYVTSLLILFSCLTCDMGVSLFMQSAVISPS